MGGRLRAVRALRGTGTRVGRGGVGRRFPSAAALGRGNCPAPVPPARPQQPSGRGPGRRREFPSHEGHAPHGAAHPYPANFRFYFSLLTLCHDNEGLLGLKFGLEATTGERY